MLLKFKLFPIFLKSYKVGKTIWECLGLELQLILSVLVHLKLKFNFLSYLKGYAPTFFQVSMFKMNFNSLFQQNESALPPSIKSSPFKCHCLKWISTVFSKLPRTLSPSSWFRTRTRLSSGSPGTNLINLSGPKLRHHEPSMMTLSIKYVA